MVDTCLVALGQPRLAGVLATGLGAAGLVAGVLLLVVVWGWMVLCGGGSWRHMREQLQVWLQQLKLLLLLLEAVVPLLVAVWHPRHSSSRMLRLGMEVPRALP